MKSLLLKLFTVLVGLVVLVGCGNDEANNNAGQNQESNSNTTETSDQKEEASITVTVTKDKEAEVIEEKEIVIEDGDILLDVMKENFDLEEKEPGFIISIEGIVADEAESMFWALSVNGEMSQVGAAEVELKNGDSVNFDLQSWE